MTIGDFNQTEFKTQDAASYNPIAQNFDRFVTRFSKPLASRVVALSNLTLESKVLDVGTGTGIVAFHAASQIGARGKVVGIDLSDGMLEVAKAHARQMRFEGFVKFQKMDAEALSFQDGSFDNVVSLFALRHFPHPDIALKEMHRVLRPGGNLAIAVGSGSPLLSLCGIVHRLKLLPHILLRLQGKQLVACEFLDSLVEKHLQPSSNAEEAAWTKKHPHMTKSVLTLVRRAGFKGIRWEWTGQQIIVPTAEEFWEIQVTFSSLTRKRLSHASPDSAKDLREKFMTICQEVQARGGQLVYPTGAFVVCGKRP